MKRYDVRKIFGENVKSYRKKMGLSQEALSEKLGISPNHLSVIETGKKFVTYKLLEEIIATLQVMPMTLFFAEGTAPFDESNFNRINSIIKSGLDSCAAKIQRDIQSEFSKRPKPKNARRQGIWRKF